MPGCSEAYGGTNLAITASTGVVSAKQNVNTGYADSVCVKCSNAAGSTITYDNWMVVQKPNCETITANSLADKVYDYNAAATTTAVYTSAEAFTNTNTTGCPITSCTL